MSDVLATNAELEALRKAAGIPHLPTQLTFEARLAIGGEGPRAYDWSDKPHRLVFDLCREIEKNAAERDRLAAAVDAVMADRKRILDERDRGFVMVMERAERAEAEVARLTALLPHPGETAAEVMWRNHQRGVRMEELAKAAGVTRERARLMVRKAEMRMGDK